QERGLESIFGGVPILQDAPADPQDHGAMTLHQFRERRLVLLANETFQQLAVRDRRLRLRTDQPAKVMQNLVQLSLGHSIPFGAIWVIYLSSVGQPGGKLHFLENLSHCFSGLAGQTVRWNEGRWGEMRENEAQRRCQKSDRLENPPTGSPLCDP